MLQISELYQTFRRPGCANQLKVPRARCPRLRTQLPVVDEPFAGLDPSAVASLSEMLRAETAQGIE